MSYDFFAKAPCIKFVPIRFSPSAAAISRAGIISGGAKKAPKKAMLKAPAIIYLLTFL